MVARAGQPAPAFEARSDEGQWLSLAALRGRWVALTFWPDQGAADCAWARPFEEARPDFERLGAVIVAVSADTEARLALLRDRCGLGFTLLPDGAGTLARAYGLGAAAGRQDTGGWLARLRRGRRERAAGQTFLIDPLGTLAHHWPHAPLSGHPAEVLGELRRRQAP